MSAYLIVACYLIHDLTQCGIFLRTPGDKLAGPGQGQEARGLEVIGGQSIHRVTAAAFAAARPGIWPGGLHRAPAASAGCAAMRAP